jgi:hypothetical protein
VNRLAPVEFRFGLVGHEAVRCPLLRRRAFDC